MLKSGDEISMEKILKARRVMYCIFFSISDINVQVSQEYKNLDMTRERIRSDVYVLVVPNGLGISKCCYSQSNPGAYFMKGSPLSVTMAPRYLEK